MFLPFVEQLVTIKICNDYNNLFRFVYIQNINVSNPVLAEATPDSLNSLFHGKNTTLNSVKFLFCLITTKCVEEV